MCARFLRRTDIYPAFQLGLHLGEAPVIDPNLFVGRLSELERMEEILQGSQSGE
jgi:hypothetical protein